ncbi:MAG TPA: hypothetical protein VFA18_24350 [Gemmataceae bacterium]|nr:hypothetical protein [Gemmataceae bacterium]
MTSTRETITAEALRVVREQLESAGLIVTRKNLGRLQTIIADHPDGKRLVFLVRGRIRERDNVHEGINIFASASRGLSPDEQLLQFERLSVAAHFTPWIVVYVRKTGDLYAMTVAHLQVKYRGTQKVPTLPMTREAKEAYSLDEAVMHVNVRGSEDYPTRWFGRAK